MDVYEDHQAFARIVGRLEDPEDRMDRRTAFAGYATGLAGFLIVLASYLFQASLAAIGLGLLVMAIGNLAALKAVRRVLARRSMG